MNYLKREWVAGKWAFAQSCYNVSLEQEMRNTDSILDSLSSGEILQHHISHTKESISGPLESGSKL